MLHPDHLLRQITSAQWTEWIAYHRIEPFGDQMADLRAGIVAATVANVQRARGSKALLPIDFMPHAERPKNTNLAADLKNALSRMTIHGPAR